MAMTMVQRAERRHRVTVAEFLAICATDPSRYKGFELVNGEIWEPMSESEEHASLVERIADALKSRLAEDGYVVRSHGSVVLDGDGMPLPDVFVVQPGEALNGDFWNGTQLDMVVEVARTTTYEAFVKAADYARGGVPVYYIVLADDDKRVVRRYEQPEDGEYTTMSTITFDSLLSQG